MKIRSVKIASILVLLFISLLWVCLTGAKIYTWTDESGIKHFGNAPPAEGHNVRVMGPEYQYDEAADKKQNAEEHEQTQKLIKEIDESYEKEQQEKKRQAEEAERNRPPTKEEKINAERDRLEAIIRDLEAKPLEYFGSQRNKIKRLGYYNYRLNDLMKDPDKYFNNPVGFEGNVKPLVEENTNN
jgi:hypothetical protein